MTTALTTLRSAVMAQLAEDLDMRFVPGELKGPIPGLTQDLGCVFGLRAEPNRRDVNMRDDILVVRVFLARYQEQDPNFEQPLDPTPLEETEQAIIASLQPVQADQDIQAGYFQWTASLFEHSWQAVEVQFRSWHQSEFALGG